MTSTEDAFTQMVHVAVARAKNLQKRVYAGNRNDAERDLNTCHALIQNLYDHATRNGIYMRNYDDLFIEMQTILMDIEYVLTNPQNRSFWGRLAEGVKFVIRLIAWLFRLSPFPALPHHKPKALP